MSADQGTLGIRLPRVFLLLIGAALGILFVLVLLSLSARPAGAATLPGLPNPVSAVTSPVTTTLGDATAGVASTVGNTVSAVPTGVVSPALPVIGSVVSAPTGLLGGAAGSVQSLGGSNGPIGTLPALTVPALPVLSSSPPALLGGIVGQGPRSMPTEPSPPQSAAIVGVVLRTGSAAFLSQRIPTGAASAGGPTWPVDPQPRHPSTPALPPAGTVSYSGSGAHNGPLDSLPPTILVLALLVAGGLGLERRRRPKARFDLRFSPPG
jgi:hypothetical protein